MILLLKKIASKIFNMGGYRKDKVDALRKKGAKIGKGVMLYSEDIFIDEGRPWLLEIGEYTKITHQCIILTHDYSLSVLRRVYGEWIGEGQVTHIGKNCFIGMGSIILMGTHIGDNVIVGAGSVVHGTIPDNVLVAGNPAKVICTLDEHYNKRKQQTKEEALTCANAFYSSIGREPKPADLSGFKFLFTPRNKETVAEYGLNFQCTGDEPLEVEDAFYRSEPVWASYKEFLKDAKKKREKD